MKTRPLLLLLFFLSGAAGLGYEILWTRMFAVGLGHEIVSMLAVISAFFSGIALGAWIFDRPVSRSATPGHWYAGFELAIALWALCLALLIPEVTPRVSALIGLEPTPLRHWSLAFFIPFIMLLPATAAMGGTLPAMDRLFSQPLRDRSVAALYSANTFGAMAGTLAVPFFLLPALGTASSALLLAAANILGAGGVLLLGHGPDAPAVSVAKVDRSDRRLYLILFSTGLLGIGFEIAMVRVLNQLLENTVYSFAVLLAVYLFGTAAGAALYQRYGRTRSLAPPLAFLLHGTALACLVSMVLLGAAGEIIAFVRQTFGPGFGASILAELTLALTVFFLPTVAMGATFSHLAQHLRKSDGGVGRALGLNTLGGACAPPVLGLWLIPTAGMKSALLLVAAGYLLLMPAFCLRCRPMTVAAAVLGTLIFLHPADQRFITLSADENVLFHREGVMASVAVVADRKGEAHLRVDNRFQMGGTTSVYSDRRQALLPLLLHQKPESALFLGLGTGITFAAAADYPGLQADGVELIPEVIEAMPTFAKANSDLVTAKNLRVIAADARRYVATTPNKYDVVIADLFHPARDGAASLYTVEHFAAVRNLLQPDGLFCQWLPLYQMDLDTLRMIMKTFLEVFPEGQAYLAHYSLEDPIIGLVGAKAPLRYPERWFQAKLQDEQIRRKVLPLKYDSFYSLFGTFLAGSDQLKKICGDIPLNTDDQPMVLFSAPHFVYGEPASAGDRLLALVQELSPPDPEAILAPPVTEEDYLARDRLLAYWDARNSFLQTGMKIARTTDVKRLYETAREPLLAVVRKSLDFSAAYFPLLAIAYEIFPQDREASYQLFSDLMRANPMRREAYLMRRNLFEESDR